MKKKVLVGLIMLFLIQIVVAQSPDIKVTERFTEDYWRNGSVDAITLNQGYVEVFTDNKNDTLQYVRLNMSAQADTNTNISVHTDANGETWHFYRGAVPNATRLFRDGDYDTYSLNSTSFPRLQLSMSIQNYAGGNDVYNNDSYPTASNFLLITVNVTNPNPNFNFTSANVTLIFNNNTFGSNDILSITGAQANNGGLSISDKNSNSEFETLEWNGYVNPASTLQITFNATTTSGINFADIATSFNLNNDNGIVGGTALFSKTGYSINPGNLLSNMTIAKKFSRGPVREGIDMLLAQNGQWRVRGFFKNIADLAGKGLNYNVSGWEIHEVDPTTGAPKNPANLTAIVNWNVTPGTTQYTDWFDTGHTGKPYFTTAYNWSVFWQGNESYYVEVTSTIDFQTMYVIDIQNNKAFTGSLTPSGGTIYVSDSVTYLGDANIPGLNGTIYSAIPWNATYPNGSSSGFINFTVNCSSVSVFVNGTDITKNVSITCVNSSTGANAYVKVNILNFSATDYGSYFIPNDVLYVNYSFSTISSIDTDASFNLTGNSTIYTPSGTPITELYPIVELKAVEKRLTAYKEIKIWNPLNPTLVNVTIRIDAIDQSTAQNGIAGIKLVDYVPNGTNFSIGSVYWVYNGTQLINGTNADITNKGIVILSDGIPAFAYEYGGNATGFWNGTMFDNTYLEIRYQMNITDSGAYTLPVEIFGLDPDTGETLTGTSYGAVSVLTSEPAIPLKITDSELELAKTVVVGKPAQWMKSFEVFNPNKRPLTVKFDTTIFRDTLQAYVSYYDELGNRIEEKAELDSGTLFWETKIGAFETRTYDIRVNTPPILEVDRNVEVLEKLADNRVKLQLELYLKSFAKEDYDNVKLNLPMDFSKVIEISSGGRRLEFDGNEGLTTVNIGKFLAESTMTLTVVYKESYPAIIVTPDKDRYDSDSPVGLSILIINGGEELDNPYLETEIYDPEMDTVYLSQIDIKNLMPLERTETTEKFWLPMSTPTGNYVAEVKFREDFTTVSHGSSNFYVLGKRMSSLRNLEILLIVGLGMTLLVLTYKRAKYVAR